MRRSLDGFDRSLTCAARQRIPSHDREGVEWSSLFIAGFFAALLSYTLVRHAGADSNGWLIPGAVFAVFAVFSLRESFLTNFGQFWPLLSLPACIALQLLPWPAHTVASSLTLMQLARVVVYLCCFAAAREIAARRPSAAWMLFAIPLAFGCAEAIFGIAQHAMRGEDNYAVGTFPEHSHFAGFVDLLLPVSIVSVWRYRHPLAIAPPLIFFAALLHSFSRAGLAASALAIVAMVLIRTRQFKMAGAALVAITLAGLILAPTGLGERFGRISTYAGFHHDAQLTRWHDTLRMIEARPILGSGAGTYQVAFAPFDTSAKSQHDHADNDYLQLLAEIGIGGTLATLALLAVALRRYARAARWSLVALGAAGSMIALLAHSMFEFQMYIPANVLTLAWIAGVGWGVTMKPSARPTPSV
jgi:O-antigen ligase